MSIHTQLKSGVKLLYSSYNKWIFYTLSIFYIQRNKIKCLPILKFE